MADGISVVVPVYNRVDDLERCLRSLEGSFDHLRKRRQAFIQLDVVVVDDHSTEEIAAVANRFAFVRCIRNSGKGPGAARSEGMHAAKYECIGFIDSDCIADASWLTRIVESFADPEVLALQGNPCLFMKTANKRLGTCEEKLYSGMFARYVKGNECTQIDTRNCAFRKQVYGAIEAELFITDMKQAQAEARVCGNNLVAQGVRIQYDSRMLVYHKDPSSIRESMRQKMRHGSGRVYVWNKTPPITQLLARYFIRPIFEFGVPFWYVLPTHTAFLFGYANARRRLRS